MKKIFLLLTILVSAFSMYGQMVDDPTTWTYSTKKISDDTYDVIAKCKIKSEWHLWSNKPGGDGLQTPTAITLDKNPNIELVGGIKESGKRLSKEFKGVDGIAHYFENSATFKQRIKVKGNTTIKAELSYQTCDHEKCLAPTYKPFSLKITDFKKKEEPKKVEPKEVLNKRTPQEIKDSTDKAIAEANQKNAADDEVINDESPNETDTLGVGDTGENTNDLNVTADNSNPDGDSVNQEGESEKTKSNWLLLLEGMLGGLISIITPCVFAMLPMTVSFFIKRTKDKKSGIKVALQYCISIIIIFALLGLLLTFVNNKNVLYELSSHWITNVIFFIVFVVFGLSFMGAFEITLPAKWSTAADKKANMSSFSGIFFMALTLAIVSFSCTAPFLGGLIYEISQGSRIGPLFGFTGFGIGLALPFLLFVLFPGMLNALNKQGGWLNAVKVTFGIVELALAFKFLSNADLYKGWGLLDREIFIGIWIALALCLALYLFGLIRFSHDSELPKNDFGQPYLSVTRSLFGVTAVIFALYMLPGMWGAPLNGMGAFVPPMGTQDFVLSSGGSAAGPVHENTNKYASKFLAYEPEVVKINGMNTYFDYDEALQAAKDQGKPIMLDFTGITCVNCRKMETEVWSDPEVFKRMKNDFIVASLFCDARDDKYLLPEDEWYENKTSGITIKTIGQKNLDIQSVIYHANTQPNYFFISPEGKLLAEKGYGYDPDIPKFIEHLDGVLEKFEKSK
jgi:thiol:disulfide interchange protein DsbD